jgi:hypothetical protein
MAESRMPKQMADSPGYAQSQPHVPLLWKHSAAVLLLMFFDISGRITATMPSGS